MDNSVSDFHRVMYEIPRRLWDFGRQQTGSTCRCSVIPNCESGTQWPLRGRNANNVRLKPHTFTPQILPRTLNVEFTTLVDCLPCTFERHCSFRRAELALTITIDRRASCWTATTSSSPPQLWVSLRTPFLQVLGFKEAVATDPFAEMSIKANSDDC